MKRIIENSTMAALTTALMLAAGCADGKTTFPGKEWETASPQSQGVDRAKMDAAITYLAGELRDDRDGVNELVVVRNGYLLHAGPGADSIRDVYSAAKSFTSLMMGLAVDDGLCGVDTRAAAVLPELAEKYPDVTFRHLLTQTSGYDAPKDSFLDAADPRFAPGAYFEYGSVWFKLVRTSLSRLWNRPLADVLDERICSRIGINRSAWKWDRAGVAENGGAVHMQISARSFARIGWLLANDGVWDGDTLVSPAYVREMSRVQVPATVAPFDSTGWYRILPGAYGLGCWVNGVRHLDGRRQFPSAPEGTWVLQGNKNNYCVIIPEWSMVVVRTGNHKLVNADWDGFFLRLGAAVTVPGGRQQRTVQAGAPDGAGVLR